MASLSAEKIRSSVAEILKDADLSSLSSKKVRQMLEEKHKVDLGDRKKEVDSIIMEMIEASQSENTADTEEEEKPKSRRTAANGASDQSDADSGSDEGNDEEYSPQKRSKGAASKPGPKSKKVKSKAEASDSEGSDDEMDDEALARKLQEEEKKGRSRAAKKSPGEKKAKSQPKKKKESTYARKCILSPELAEVVGAPEMARHDVVKKMWAIVKDRNLYDPKNKQFAICDDQLHKVFGVKRFRTFGMMKYLKNHIKDPPR